MAKLKYLRAYQGIQPGTIVNEHRDDVVERLTKIEFVIDDKGVRRDITPYAQVVADSIPTTADNERAEKKKKDDEKAKAKANPNPK